MSKRTMAGVMAMAMLTAGAQAADLPAWKMAELKTLSGWGAPAKDGDHSYCAVPAGKSASFTVPVWWGQGFRPPEGTVYVLRVSYKDTAGKPAVFSSHAGNGNYWGLSEVHRFGGSGDGAWKTADVPLSWDLVCRKNVPQQGPGDVTEFAISSDQELPVESITVVPAEAGSAEKYRQETRAWIAKAQEAKRANADQGAKQQPVLPEELKDKAMVPFVRSYLVVVMRNDSPQKGEAGTPAKVRMARNEWETVAFGVYANTQDLKNVKYTAGAFTGPGGNLACELEPLTSEYAVVSAGKDKFQLYPQRLWPAYPVDIPKGQSHWFCLNIRTLGEKTRPGKYTGAVKLTAEGGVSAELPVELEVVPVTLLSMEQADLELGTCGFATLQELRTLAQYNHTGLDIWFGGTQPQMKVDADKKLRLDYTYLDDWMEYAVKKCGMTHMMWFMGGDPYGFPDTLNLERDLYRAQPGENAALRKEFIEKTMDKPEKVIDGLRELYLDFIRQTAKHAQEKGWPKRIIIHPFDEPAKWEQRSVWDNPFHKVLGAGPWIKPHFQDCCALIREGAKGYKGILTGGDIHHAKPGMVFLKDIDVFCTNAIHEDAKLGDKVRAGGVQFWQYSGGGDHAPAHQGRYAFGFYFGAFDARGYLIWAYNAMKRFDTSEGSNWGYGWYTPFGTAIAPYIIGVREGCDDRRWMETYRKQVGADAAKALLEDIGKEAVAGRTAGGRDTVSDFYAEVKRHEQMDVWRGKVIDALLKTGK